VIPGFGKQNLTIGSSPSCDVVLAGEGVMPEHARLVHQAGGKLLFVCGHGAATANGRPLAPGEHAPFDFRTQFTVGAAQLPLHHPAITLSLLTTGTLNAPPGQLILGRDPTKASLVIQHPSVSSQHATVTLDRMMVIDHSSTSGTYVGTTKIAPGTPTPIDPNGILAFGPVPVQVSLLMRLAQAMAARGPQNSLNTPGPSAVQPAPAPQGAVSAQVGTQMMGAAGAAAAMAGAAGAPAAGSPAKKNKTVLGQLDFSGGGAAGSVKSIGRTPGQRHRPQRTRRCRATTRLLHNVGGQLFVEDRGSANGTFVRGHRIPRGQKIGVQSGEKIYIGPMPLQIEQSASGAAEIVQEEYSADAGGPPALRDRGLEPGLEVPDRDNPREMKALLENVSFKALPGDMIALMGPSGAGKTTLLLTLNGYLPPTSGMVRINGEDLYTIYDNLRGSIGYVPQDDLVHPELTVFEAVRYSAKFRLPPDYSEDEIDARVDQTIKDLGLEGVRNLQIGKPEKKILSGGQRKRVNIALELVTDPVILFLDEPTSGLAADDTTALITLLSDLTKQTGKTIIMTIHQPAKDEFEKFTHCLIMGYGGVPMFFGPNKDAYRFFGTWKERQRSRTTSTTRATCSR
jgi:ABC-type multidrug transport system ATPase subunit/pSer/pThr/pTyr-binding forkhead associated (FHA) protein